MIIQPISFTNSHFPFAKHYCKVFFKQLMTNKETSNDDVDSEKYYTIWDWTSRKPLTAACKKGDTISNSSHFASFILPSLTKLLLGYKSNRKRKFTIRTKFLTSFKFNKILYSLSQKPK